MSHVLDQHIIPRSLPGQAQAERPTMASWLTNASAYVLRHSHKRSAAQRAAVVKAAAQGDLDGALDAMLAWAIAERKAGR